MARRNFRTSVYFVFCFFFLLMLWEGVSAGRTPQEADETDFRLFDRRVQTNANCCCYSACLFA